jgi:hypothetical protein
VRNGIRGAGIGAGISASSAHAYSNYESELVPAAVVVGLIDASALGEQADQKRQWSDYAVPETSQKSCGPRIWFFVLRIGTSDRERVCHCGGIIERHSC